MSCVCVCVMCLHCSLQYRVNVDNATQTLDNFCQWQSEMNGTRVTAGGGLSSYHDVAVLFTG